MKNHFATFLFCAALLLSALAFAPAVHAEDVKMVGTISRLTLAADGKSATAVLKDSKSGEDVTITVTDDLTLDKFKDKRIVEGDEIRCKYDKEPGKNSAKIFKKTAGC